MHPRCRQWTRTIQPRHGRAAHSCKVLGIERSSEQIALAFKMAAEAGDLDKVDFRGGDAVNLVLNEQRVEYLRPRPHSIPPRTRPRSTRRRQGDGQSRQARWQNRPRR